MPKSFPELHGNLNFRRGKTHGVNFAEKWRRLPKLGSDRDILLKLNELEWNDVIDWIIMKLIFKMKVTGVIRGDFNKCQLSLIITFSVNNHWVN